MSEANLDKFFIAYFRSTPEKVWEAMTKPEFTQHYYFGTQVESTFEVDAPIAYFYENDEGERQDGVVGKILECEPMKTLAHTFRFPHTSDAVTYVTYKLEQMNDEIVKMWVYHEGFEEENETLRSISVGWFPILNALKTLLETGEPLVIP